MTTYEKFNEVVETLLEFGLDLEQAESEALILFSEEEKKEIICSWEKDMLEYEQMLESSHELVGPVVPEDIPW